MQGQGKGFNKRWRKKWRLLTNDESTTKTGHYFLTKNINLLLYFRQDNLRHVVNCTRHITDVSVSANYKYNVREVKTRL
jgi:hypothetical protein